MHKKCNTYALEGTHHPTVAMRTKFLGKHVYAYYNIYNSQASAVHSDRVLYTTLGGSIEINEHHIIIIFFFPKMRLTVNSTTASACIVYILYNSKIQTLCVRPVYVFHEAENYIFHLFIILFPFFFFKFFYIGK